MPGKLLTRPVVVIDRMPGNEEFCGNRTVVYNKFMQFAVELQVAFLGRVWYNTSRKFQLIEIQVNIQKGGCRL